jgi:hypothetical protein
MTQPNPEAAPDLADIIAQALGTDAKAHLQAAWPAVVAGAPPRFVKAVGQHVTDRAAGLVRPLLKPPVALGLAWVPWSEAPRNLAPVMLWGRRKRSADTDWSTPFAVSGKVIRGVAYPDGLIRSSAFEPIMVATFAAPAPL